MTPTSRAERWFQSLSLARQLITIGVIAAAASPVMADTTLVHLRHLCRVRDEVRGIVIIATVTGIASPAAVSLDDGVYCTSNLRPLRDPESREARRSTEPVRRHVSRGHNRDNCHSTVR
jgi:hypothetical protein